jgi:MFS family permease
VSVLPDLEPLRAFPAYRRLYTGNALAAVSAQLAVAAIGIQVYDLTGSTAAVGLVGVFAFAPLMVMGLYGGTLSDRYDRRRVGLTSQGVSWSTSVVCAALAVAGNTSVWPLYLVAAFWSGSFAVTSPARSSIYPRILPARLLPAANALSVLSMTVAMAVGPLLAGVLIDAGSFRTAYLADAVITTAGLWGFSGLPPIPPEEHAPTVSGLRSVVDGLAYLAAMPNVRMTFVADVAAMVLAQPSVLLPAAGTVILGGGARSVGLLYAAVAVGGVAAMLASGPLGEVRHQGRAIMTSIVGWGAGVTGFGVALLVAGTLGRTAALVVAVAGLMLAGAADSVSAVFRTTILQAAAPDRMRGRLQGVFIVVVAGGPRLGGLLAGVLATGLGEGLTAVLGGLACIATIAALSVVQRGFLAYDSRHPTP